MSGVDLSFDEGAAVDRLMRFLAVEGVMGREKAIGREVARALEEAGVPLRAVRHDRAHERIPLVPRGDRGGQGLRSRARGVWGRVDGRLVHGLTLLVNANRCTPR
jgi:hypothetical protein